MIFVLTCIAGIILLTLLQDRVEAFINQFPFYLSEALLFKTTWILFFPFILLQGFLFNKMASDRSILKKILCTGLPFTLHLLFIPLVIWSFSILFFDHTYTFSRTLEYTLSEDLYKLVLGYSFVPLLLKKKLTVEQLPLPVAENLHKEHCTMEKIMIHNGRTHTPINVNEIQYILAATPYIAIHVSTKSYLDTGTLKSIHTQLDKRNFIRIHKSSIVNIRHVNSYASRSNGDYDLTMANRTVLRLSRNFALDFKTAFEAVTPVNL